MQMVASLDLFHTIKWRISGGKTIQIRKHHEG